MIKRNKGTLILTTIIMLLPMFVGLIIWNKLPEQVPVHWNINGQVDGWGSKSMLVFFLPLFLIGIHWLCALATSLDPKGANVKGKLSQLVLWICPFLSLLTNTLVYSKILGYDIAVEIIMPVTLGLLFLFIGNLLPKCRQNFTLGIKLPWTLSDEENWNKTHRFAGKLWVIGGAVMVATAVFANVIIFLTIVLLMVLVPTIYSYLLYRKQKKTAA